MASQRERIRALIDALERVSHPGTFGPEPANMTPEIADQLHQLGSLLRDYGARERANRREQAKRRGERFNRAELLDDDAEDAAHAVLDALHQLRSCPAEDVEQWRHAAHGALEQCGVAITDPAHRADAGMSRELRPRSREVMAARRGDAEERDRIIAHRDAVVAQMALIRDRTSQLETALVEEQRKVQVAKADMVKLRNEQQALVQETQLAKDLALRTAQQAQDKADELQVKLARVVAERDEAKQKAVQ